MTFARGVFVFAFVMLLAGIFGSRYILQPFLDGGGPNPMLAAVADTATPKAEPVHATPTGTSATVSPTPAGTATATATPGATGTPTLTVTPPVSHTPTITPIPSPTPSPTAGTVTLDRYWVGASAARRGSIISVGYVITNGTGQTAHVMLGASIKSSRVLSWAAGTISDPSHDVVAIVPPGVSTHTRFFTLPASLHPGSYDVAWGLRDAATGERLGLVAAVDALTVER